MIGALRRLFGGVETRQAGYTDAILAAQLGAATAGTATAAATAGVQIAAGLVGRALAAATPEGDGGTLTPTVLEGIGVDLVRAGQALLLLRVDGRGPKLLRAGAVESVITGGGDPESWGYTLSISGPSEARAVPATAAEVAHVRWNADSYRPWHGIAPLSRAALTGALAANLETSLGHEAAVMVARVIAFPGGVGQDMADHMRAVIRDTPGRIAFPETTNKGFGAGATNAPQADWVPRRLGPEYQPADPALYQAVTAAVLAACGVPPALADPSAAGPGQREAGRAFLTTTIQPLGALIEAEVSRVLERPVKLRHHRLAAADVASRARAVHVLTEAGVDVDEARMLVGW